ncbi:MAG: hypothetical protein ACD_79C00965G0003 [uncultured bacterium]|nr:MAG: hypothetical protein ACD_79C00965G0003 [uncultured bacterium]
MIKNGDLRKKLVSCVLLFAVFGITSLLSIYILKEKINKVTFNNNSSQINLQELRFSGLRIYSSTNEIIFFLQSLHINQNADYTQIIQNEKNEVTDAQRRFLSALNLLKKLNASNENLNNLLNNIEITGKKFTNKCQIILGNIENKQFNNEEIVKTKEELEICEEQFLSSLDSGFQYLQQNLTNGKETLDKYVFNSELLLILLLLISIFILVSLFRKISDKISNEVSSIQFNMNEASKGNFTTILNTREYLYEIAASFNTMLDNIKLNLNKENEINTLKNSLQRLQEEKNTIINSLKIEVDSLNSKLSTCETELLKANSQIKESNKIKYEFLANITHELRTPMNGIIGMTELVLSMDLADEQMEYLNLAKTSAYQLLDIINDILDFSKIQAGKLKLEQSHFDIKELIYNITLPLSEKAKQKNVSINVSLSDQIPKFLLGDISRVRQIIFNLIDNAIKFTPSGEINITCGIIPQPATGLPKIHFIVQDTGIGISRENQTKIFEAFTQADGSLTRQFGGTGLGLAISSYLIKLMGGKIWFKSAPGIGSTFEFTIPLQEHLTQVEGFYLAPIKYLKNLKILIIDRNSQNAEHIKSLISGWVLTVQSANNSRTALEILKNDKYDLIIMDTILDEMNGFDLAELINNEFKELRIPIMMISSSGVRGDSLKCSDLQIEAYLTRPIIMTDMLIAIRVLYNRKTASNKTPSLITKYTINEIKNSVNIMIAEDDYTNKVLLIKLIKQEGFNILSADNGKEVLNTIEISKTDLILMDIRMPEMDGIIATTIIREKEKSSKKHIPIIAITSKDKPEDKEECLSAGFDYYMSKPIQKNELMRVINSLI